MLGDRAKRDGVRLRLGYIEVDFEQPHPAEFDHQYIRIWACKGACQLSLAGRTSGILMARPESAT